MARCHFLESGLGLFVNAGGRRKTLAEVETIQHRQEREIPIHTVVCPLAAQPKTTRNATHTLTPACFHLFASCALPSLFLPAPASPLPT